MAAGKKLIKAREGINREKLYPLVNAIKMVKERAKSKFDETIEIAINLGVDPRHADQMVRGVVTLPNGTGRTLRVGVFARGAKADEARAAGADVVGAEDLVEKVQGGTIEFDRCIATPDMMPLVGRLGKVLGPRGMMPNPKIGTVTMDVTSAVKGAKGGSVEFRVEKAGIVQAGVGKASFRGPMRPPSVWRNAMGPFPHDAPPAKISDDNPAGTDGFEFVEFAHPEPEKLRELFTRMGYVAGRQAHDEGHHRLAPGRHQLCRSMPSPARMR